jgi:hypothetical protein
MCDLAPPSPQRFARQFERMWTQFQPSPNNLPCSHSARLRDGGHLVHALDQPPRAELVLIISRDCGD